MEDPRSPRGRSKADSETYKFPIKEIGHLYVSANSPHTIKYRMPALVKKALIIGGIGALALGSAWFLLFRNAYSSISDSKGKPAAAGEATPNPSRGAASRASSGSRAGKQEPKWATLTDYATDHVPRFGMAPWTARVYDDREVTADPQLYCLSSKPGEDAQGHWQDLTCTCLTEQGTAYVIPHGECRTLARQGPVYNPYRREMASAAASAPSSEHQAQVQASSDPGVSIGYRPGTRADTFPRSPGYETGQTFTGPTLGL